jgi:rod shape-determining protein MreC
MDNIIKRHANLTILGAVLFAQILGLAIQIKRPNSEEGESTLLIRQWTLAAITPLEKAFVHGTSAIRDGWNGYFYLRTVRRQNEELKDEIARMRLEQVRLQQDAAQARRLQALLDFKEQYVSQTVAAQVIGSSGSEQSRVVYIDRGVDHGIQENMAVITPSGIVGKVLRVFPGTAQVLVITDQTSGVGAILEKTRLQGIAKGAADGGVKLDYVMSDEKVEVGDTVITSGGDKIFPKGLALGRVASVAPGKNMFLNIRLTPAADLGRLEEVLVITKMVEKAPDVNDANGPIRAVDILAERLPSVPVKPPEAEKTGQPAAGTTATPANAVNTPKPGTAAASAPSTPASKPATGGATPTVAGASNKPVVKAPAGAAATNTNAPAKIVPPKPAENDAASKPAAEVPKKPAPKPANTTTEPNPTAQEH